MKVMLCGGGAIFEEKAVKVRNQYNPRVLLEEFSIKWEGGGMFGTGTIIALDIFI